MPFERDCLICRAHFRTAFIEAVVCLKCQNKLPKCDTCHTVLGWQYGFLEDSARTIGVAWKVCTSCNYEIINKGFLHLEPSRVPKRERFLLPDGQIVSEMPAR